jgi:hypothetical protein
MIVDVQVTTDAFLQGIRNELRSRPICFTQELKLGTDTILLDHFEITDNTSLNTVPTRTQVIVKGVPQSLDASALLVTQEVVLCFATITELQSNGAAPTSITNPIMRQSITVQFLVTAVLIGGRPQFQVTYHPPANAGGLEAIQPGIGKMIDLQLASFSGNLPINLNAIDQLMGFSPLFTNAGTMIAGSRLSLLLEDSTDLDSATTWANFYAGLFPDRLDGKSWAVFIDKRLLLPVVLNIANSPKGGDFEPSGAPGADWSGNGHGVHAWQSGVLPDAGPLDTDVDVTVNVDLNYSVPSVDILQLDLSLSASGEPSGFLGSILDFFGFGGDASGALPPAAGWIKSGDASYKRSMFVAFTDPLLGHLALETVIPDPGGLHVAGTVHPSVVIPANLQATLKPFAWGVHGSCGSGWDISCLGSIGLENIGTAPLVLCSARVLFDPDNQFPVTEVFPDSPSSLYVAVVSVKIQALSTQYANRPSPYPCLLLVQTNGGARVVSLGVPTNMSDAQNVNLQEKHAWLVVSCFKLVDHFWGSGLNPKWIPDPPVDDRVLHLWQVLVRGLENQDQVAIVEGKDRIVAIGQPGETGAAYARSVIPSTRGSHIGIVRIRGGSSPQQQRRLVVSPQRDNRSVQIRQVSLELCATMKVGFDNASLVGVQVSGEPGLAIIQATRASIVDLQMPDRPQVLRTVSVADLSSEHVVLAPPDIPFGFDEQHAGPTRTNSGGVLVGDIFVDLKGVNLQVYKPTHTVLLQQLSG